MTTTSCVTSPLKLVPMRTPMPLCQEPGKNCKIHWFDKMSIKSRFFRTALRCELTPAAKRHELQIIRPVLLSDPRRGVVSIEAWHADVQHDHVRIEAVHLINRLKTVVGSLHLVTQ